MVGAWSRSGSTARDGAAAERRLWHVETTTGVHLVDILPSALGGSVAVELDGRKVARLAKPTDARTSSMATFDLDGSRLTVLLTVAHPVMHVEVFRDGVSLADGRTIEAARRSVPAPVPRFERWTDTGLTGVSSAAIAPAWVWATIVVAILVVIAGVAVARSVVLAMIGVWVLIGIFVRGWMIVTARAHRYLRGQGRPRGLDPARAAVGRLPGGADRVGLHPARRVARLDLRRGSTRARGGVRACGTIASVRFVRPPRRRRVSSPPPAKFFVNQGVVTSRTDMLHLLRPLLKQTVTYRYVRGREVVAHGTGWMERIVVDSDDTSTYFTPLAITLNIDSFEHLEFETRPDQLLVYTLVQGDERVIVEFAPIGPEVASDSPFAPRQLAFDTSEFVQMELQGLDVRADED